MQIGINIRVMGEQSSRVTISELLKQAEQSGIESAWIVDHIAIPPDDAEGSGGRYLDPLTTMAFMAGQTTTIKIGTSVLILPYRPKLPTAKALATIQELSDDRLLLGIGVGWMESEFNALGVDRSRRGQLTDEMLAFLRECFENDVVSLNGQEFLFRPRPTRPPLYIGGAAPHAIERALRYGDGWMPMGNIEKLRPQIADYRTQAEAEGVPSEVVTFFTPGVDALETQDKIDHYRDAGVTRVVVAQAYQSLEDWKPTFEQISQLRL